MFPPVLFPPAIYAPAVFPEPGRGVAAPSNGGGTLAASGGSGSSATFGPRSGAAGYHTPTILSIGTSAPSAGSPNVPPGVGGASFYPRQSLTIQNQHAANTLSVFFGQVAVAYLLAPGATLVDYSQSPVYLQSSGAATPAYVDPVY